jgi:hypothetical protein
MDLIPVRFLGHEFEENGEEKRVVILVPKFESGFMLNMFPKTRRMYYRIKLDFIGTESWEFIDGERNVQKITDELRSLEHIENEHLEDMEERMGKFMMMLYERKYITFKQIMDLE